MIFSLIFNIFWMWSRSYQQQILYSVLMKSFQTMYIWFKLTSALDIIHSFFMTFWKVILMVIVYDWKVSSKIQRPHHFKDRIPYTRRYFIQFLSTHVKSSYWFPVSVLKISHYLRLNYLWQVVVCYFFHRKILLSFISKYTAFGYLLNFCGKKI